MSCRDGLNAMAETVMLQLPKIKQDDQLSKTRKQHQKIKNDNSETKTLSSRNLNSMPIIIHINGGTHFSIQNTLSAHTFHKALI